VTAPRVCAIVLNYNGRQVTLEALASLEAMSYEAFDLLVVDNGSTDGSFEAVAEAFPRVHQVRTEQNLGAAGGCNLGIRWALERDYGYLLILNNDIEVDPAMLTELVRAAEEDPRRGVVGPKEYYYYGDRRRIWSAGGRLRFRHSITQERGEGQLDRGQFDRDEAVDYVNGCAMLVRRQAVEAAGLWDPLFHLAVEDADFCTRVKAQGFCCYYAHRAKLWHMVSHATGVYKAGKTFHTGRSTALFARRYGNAWQRAQVFAWMMLALPVAFGRELLRGNQAAAVAKWRGFLEGWKTPLTPPPTLNCQALDDGPG
jgi:GT2 family glycosyltransferase